MHTLAHTHNHMCVYIYIYTHYIHTRRYRFKQHQKTSLSIDISDIIIGPWTTHGQVHNILAPWAKLTQGITVSVQPEGKRLRLWIKFVEIQKWLDFMLSKIKEQLDRGRNWMWMIFLGHLHGFCYQSGRTAEEPQSLSCGNTFEKAGCRLAKYGYSRTSIDHTCVMILRSLLENLP